MKKIWLILLAFAMVATITACSSIQRNDMQSQEDKVSGTPGLALDSRPAPQPAPQDDRSKEETNLDGTLKVILTGNIFLEVENYQSAVNQIRTLIGEQGYIQASQVSSQPIFHEGEQILLRRGSLTVRIQRDRFESFLADMHAIGLVIQESTNAHDISEIYYDTEARHRLLLSEKTRLEEFLDETQDPEVYFRVLSRITEVIYEMERLMGKIQHWDDRVEYSTVQIEISEKHPDEDPAVTQPKSFFERIWDNMKDTVSFIGEAFIILVGLLPLFLILTAVIILVIVLVRLSRKRKKK